MSSETNSMDQMPKKSPLSFQVDLKKFEKATDEEKRQQDVMSESVSFFKDGMRKLMKNPLAVGSIIVLIAIIAMILIVPHVVPYKYSQIITVNGSRDKAAGNMAPFTYSEKELAYMAEGGEVFPHIMGTDSMGRDYFIRVIYGTRVSLTVGLFAAVIVLLIGVVYGSISGYFGGKVDMVMMRIVDILMSVPSFLIIITLNIYMNAGIRTLVVTIGLFSWMGVARIVRAEVLSLRERDFILASEGLGARKSWVITRHFARNVFSPVLVASTNSIASAILTESSLSYLGFGISIPNPSWGGMLEGAQTYILTHPSLAVYPGVCILLTVLCFNVLGNDGRCSIIGREIGFENIGVDADIDTSTHGNEASFEFIVEKDPEYIFVLDRDAAIQTEGAQLAQEVMENDLVKGTQAYQNGNIVYLAHPAVWYTAEGGITALDLMLQDLESELLEE